MASATALETLPVELRGLASGVLQQVGTKILYTFAIAQENTRFLLGIRRRVPFRCRDQPRASQFVSVVVCKVPRFF